MSQIDQSFAAARLLPISVSLDQVEAMIAAFPMPITTPLWKSTTMKAAAVGAIGTSAFIAFWPTNDEAPTPKYQPQIQVPIEADTTKPRVQVTATDTDTVVAIVPILELEELFPRSKGGLVNVADLDTIKRVKSTKKTEPKPLAAKPQKPAHEEDEEMDPEWEAFQDSVMLSMAHDDDCTCDCDAMDIVEWNEHLDEGVTSFYFSCENDDIGFEIEKSDLKRFEKQVSKTIKSLPGLSKKAKIDYPNDSTILVNGKVLLGQDFYEFQILFNDYEIKSGPYRKILIDKDQIWIGDFKDRNFFGTARGFNVKKSMADEWLK
ncbi:MAG: hypothetical protein NWR97_12275 [Salibacteraceae bacterium]|nr:hypothetical protein [Salibacteraceae bacterium]